MTDQTPKPSPLSRRRMFVGAGSMGALAAAAAVLPLGKTIEPVAQAAAPVAGDEGGYRLTEHVKHYYQTARV